MVCGTTAASKRQLASEERRSEERSEERRSEERSEERRSEEKEEVPARSACARWIWFLGSFGFGAFEAHGIINTPRPPGMELSVLFSPRPPATVPQ
jgi:hypothetical protein